MLKYAVIIHLSSDDEMTITPVAPCYIKRTGCERWQFLKLGNTEPIKPGDICSLLNKCWFKIVSITNTMETNDQMLKRKVDLNNEGSNNEINNKKVCLSCNAESMSSSKNLNDVPNDKDFSVKYKNSSTNENSEHSDISIPIVQEVCSASSVKENDVLTTYPKELPDSKDIELSIKQESSEKQEAENINLTNEAAMNELGKSMKQDCNVHFNKLAEESSILSEPRLNIAMRQSQANVSNSEEPRIPKREKCTYGVRCYRKNFNHKNNYSHPGDSDYDQVDDREECSYGIKCYRKNPQHKAQYKHTTVSRRRKTVTSVQSMVADISETDTSSVESVDESEYEPSVYAESSDTKSDSDDYRSEWEDGTTG